MHTTVQADNLVWAFERVCAMLRVPFEPRLFLHQCPPPVTLASAAHAAQAIGLKLAQCTLAADRLREAAFPLIAVKRAVSAAAPRGLALVLRADETGALLAEPGSDPRKLPLVELMRQFETDCLQAVGQPRGEDPGERVAGRPFGLAWFASEMFRYRGVWRDVLIASLLLQLIALLVPLATQVVVDKVIVNHTHSTLLAIAVLLSIFLVFNAALGWARQHLLLHTGNRIDAVLGMRVFEHLLRLPLRYFEQRPTGTLVARLQGVETIREFLAGATLGLALELPFALLFLAVMYWYSALLTAIALAFLAALVALSLVITPVLRARLDAQFLAGARNQAFVTEYVAAMETVKSLQLEPSLAARFGSNLAEFVQAGFATRRVANAYGITAHALEQALSFSVLLTGAWLVMSDEGFTIGMLVAFQMFAARLAQPMLRLAGMWQEFQQAAIAVRRLGDIMDAPPEMYSARPSRPAGGRGRLEIERLSFAYAGDRPALFSDFSLTVEPGSCALITGASGSGKSTLARLLQNFYLPSSGAIRIDGRDIRHLSADELRLHFSVVPQETRLFSGTLYENVLGGARHAGPEQVVEACRRAEIHGFIERLPHGYQTRVGEQGIGLSGGQKQRIAIARALLKGAPILILDEATSQLDPETAGALLRTIDRLRGSLTLVVIAHQPPPELAADTIWRLEQNVVAPAVERTAE
ncbi:MAG: peptidase domain-containing ABC transporter [Betaproteobacteria bacterium]|nr:peptidase domain-containing ABC transporter [Betaproteobacteria bacterium]